MKKYKKALMVQYPCARGRAFVCKNIGDYVQSIAARQYCNPVEEYIEQEEADQYYPEDKVPAKMIMNGWFQWRAENWPPSEYIKPLLISMHISPLRANQLLTEKGIMFLKENGPVGCRDLWTKNLLEENGVPAYFSSCLTLTLGYTYKQNEDEREGIYIVDPYFEIPDVYIEKNGKRQINKRCMMEAFGAFLKAPFAISKLAKNKFFEEYSPTGFLDRDRAWYRKYYKAIMFYKTYIQKFDKELLLEAEYITHWLDVDMNKDTNDDLLQLAEHLVKKYSAAKLLITSRIHAGLPALGMQTPVIFIANSEVTSENGSFNTPGRLEGLLELFRILELENGRFKTDDNALKNIEIITKDIILRNKDDWKQPAEELYLKCKSFMME